MNTQYDMPELDGAEEITEEMKVVDSLELGALNGVSAVIQGIFQKYEITEMDATNFVWEFSGVARYAGSDWGTILDQTKSKLVEMGIINADIPVSDSRFNMIRELAQTIKEL
jgi:hypothetical protein